MAAGPDTEGQAPARARLARWPQLRNWFLRMELLADYSCPGGRAATRPVVTPGTYL